MTPSGWSVRPLASLADYINGRAFKPEDWSHAGLPIIRIAQMTNPQAETNCYAGLDVDERHLIDNGDVLFSWSATLAVMKWNRGPAILNQHIFKVIEKPGIDKDFLVQLLRNSIDELAEHSHGSTMKHIKKGVLNQFQVPVPPLPEQKKIADILGSVDDAIQATQAVIEQTRKVKQGLLRELVSQHIPTSGADEQCLVRLSEVTTKITDGDHKTPMRSDSGFPLLGARNVQNGRLDLSVLDYVGEAEYARMIKRCHPEPDDILLSCSGTIGRVCQVPLDLKVALVRSVALVKPDTMKCRARFLYWTLQSPQLQEQMVLGQKKLAQANLFQSAISNLVLPLPSLADQDEICRILDAVLAHENATVEHLYLLKTLKIGLMADLLTGRKRVEVSA